MFTFLFGILAGLAAAAGGYIWLQGIFFPALFFLLAFFAVSTPINLWTKKKLEKYFQAVQQDVEKSQAGIQRQISQMQNKVMGSPKGLQRQFEKQQANAIREALKKMDEAEPLCRWNILARKQINTFRAQMLFQIQEFEKADQYFQNSFNADAMTLAMKMARHYKNGEQKKLEKAFKKGCRKFKGEKGVILYALYSWVLVKQDRIDDAIAVLAQGKKKTEDPVLEKNWEHLVNGRTKQFSNAGLGDTWYALHLEQPKPAKAKRRGKKKRMR